RPPRQRGQVQQPARARGSKGVRQRERGGNDLFCVRQRRGLRTAFLRQAVQPLPEAASGERVSRRGRRARDGATGDRASWRAGLGRGCARQGRGLPFLPARQARGMNSSVRISALAMLAVASGFAGGSPAAELVDLSLEQLGNIEVTSVSRRAERL